MDALKALNYMMGNQKPTGTVEVLNNTVISGWAFDPNSGAMAAMVRITRLASTLTGTSGEQPVTVRGLAPTVAQPDRSAADPAAKVRRSSSTLPA